MILNKLLDEIIKDRQQNSAFGFTTRIPIDSVVPKYEGFRIEPEKGTVELLSPEGEVLMRDNELVNQPNPYAEIKMSRMTIGIDFGKSK